jgi:hypothetical protein
MVMVRLGAGGPADQQSGDEGGGEDALHWLSFLC